MLRTGNKRDPHKKVTRPSLVATTENSQMYNDASESSAVSPCTTHISDDDAGSSGGNSLFFRVPLELRLEIYEYLLCSPDDIIVSSRRRQIYWCRPHRSTCELRRLPHRMPHVELLRTCKQVNSEATPILYRKNRFLVALPYMVPFCPTNFFLWSLRRSTMSNVTSISFVFACRDNCPLWLDLCPIIQGNFIDLKKWTTTGPQLVKLCFPYYSQSHWLPLSRRIRDVYTHIRIEASQDTTAILNGYDCGRYKEMILGRPGRKKELAPMRF
ncbi:hypothetical protein F4814DRAFT_415057 [Daldinia grandis]|nr:hypothetical protein F4814DRAFT_415057 [Daldinia grandis]